MRTTDRGVRMDRDIRLRCTPQDVEDIKGAARAQGMSVATFIRQLPIR